MHYTIERLLRGDATVVDWFVTAEQKWQDFFEGADRLTDKEWADWLSTAQGFFEHQCGGRTDGQEVMAWSGFAHLYSTDVGFEDNKERAERLEKAFAGSMVSLEVKSMAARAAASYLR